MGKGGKIVVFIIVALVVSLLASVMKEAGAGAVMSVAGIAIFILYKVMFSNSKSSETQNDENEITLNK